MGLSSRELKGKLWYGCDSCAWDTGSGRGEKKRGVGRLGGRWYLRMWQRLTRTIASAQSEHRHGAVVRLLGVQTETEGWRLSPRLALSTPCR